MPAGSIITSFTERPERIRVVGAADTLHLLFSPELAAACESTDGGRLTPARRELQAIAAQTLVAASLDGTDTRLRQVAGSLAKLVVDGCKPRHVSAGGLAPQARHVIVELLEKRISDGISVPELAAAAHLSLHHFIKVCRQSEGLTPHALLIQKRIERSIKWLLDSSISVDEIALQAGFSSPSHFISVFRRLVGVTPATLRRAARH